MPAGARLRAALAAVLSLLGLGVPSAAFSGGFTIPLIGARGATIGGFVARPDDTSAIYHNPAGLGLLDGNLVELSGTGVLTHTYFSRCTGATFDGAGSPTGCASGLDGRPRMEPPIGTAPYGGLPAGFGILPYLGLAGRFGLEKWGFGLAVYSPHNATGSFPDCRRAENGAPLDCSGAPQRFHAVLGTINTIYLSPAVAYLPHPTLSVGLSVSAVRAGITNERALWLGGPGSTASLVDGWGGEGRLRLDATAWSWAFGLGVVWELGRTLAPENPWLKGLRFGLSYSSMSRFVFRSDVGLFSPLLYSFLQENGGCRRGDASKGEVQCASKVDFTFPMQIRGGFNWAIGQEWSFGFDLYWQNYSVYDEIRVRFSQPLELSLLGRNVSVAESVEPKKSSESLTVAAGAQYAPRWAPGLELRLGLVWDQSPYPNSTYSLLSPDADKLGLVLGVTYRFRFGLELSAGYVPLFYKDRIVRDSVLRPRICPPGDAACQGLAPDAPFSANGDVRDKRVDMFLFQVGWRLGRK